MEIIIKRFIEALVMPPGGMIILILTGLAVRWRTRRRKLGIGLMASGVALLVLLSMPIASWLLIDSLQVHPPLPTRELPKGPGAIVVLGAGQYVNPPEYDQDQASPAAFARLRYAVDLHRRSGLPILVTGGRPFGEGRSEAESMAEALKRDFGVEEVWVERWSNNTWQNASKARDRLEDHRIDHIFLVTHAWHMPRAVPVFEQTGLTVTAAPTAFHTKGDGPAIFAVIPSAGALKTSRIALHEYLGTVWYWIRYR